MGNSSISRSFATKSFLCVSVKKKRFVWRERLFHQSSYRYLTYSYLRIFHKVVTERITCTNLSIFQFDSIHSLELFTRLQTFLKHLSQKNKWLIWKGRIVSLFKIGIFYLIPKGRTCISISVSIQTWVSFTLHVLRNLFYHPEIGKNGERLEKRKKCVEKWQMYRKGESAFSHLGWNLFQSKWNMFQTYMPWFLTSTGCKYLNFTLLDTFSNSLPILSTRLVSIVHGVMYRWGISWPISENEWGAGDSSQTTESYKGSFLT